MPGAFSYEDEEFFRGTYADLRAKDCGLDVGQSAFDLIRYAGDDRVMLRVARRETNGPEGVSVVDVPVTRETLVEMATDLLAMARKLRRLGHGG